MTWGTVAGLEGRRLPSASGAAGADPEEAEGEVPGVGIPCVRDRVAQTAAMLVLSPIFEADLEPEQYACRPGRSAQAAVERVHALVSKGRREVVDADLSDYFGQIPHAELLKSIARRVSDGRMLGWVKAWLEMAVVEDDGKGGQRRTNRARRERKGTPQGAPISPLLSNIYMRRFILGFKSLGFARRFDAEIVNYADDFVVLGRAPSASMLAAVEWLMGRLKLPINAEKTRCCLVPEEPIEFLGYRIGRNYRRREVRWRSRAGPASPSLGTTSAGSSAHSSSCAPSTAAPGRRRRPPRAPSGSPSRRRPPPASAPPPGRGAQVQQHFAPALSGLAHAVLDQAALSTRCSRRQREVRLPTATVCRGNRLVSRSHLQRAWQAGLFRLSRATRTTRSPTHARTVQARRPP